MQNKPIGESGASTETGAKTLACFGFRAFSLGFRGQTLGEHPDYKG